MADLKPGNTIPTTNVTKEALSGEGMCNAMIYVCFESNYEGHHIYQEGSQEAVKKSRGCIHDTQPWILE